MPYIRERRLQGMLTTKGRGKEVTETTWKNKKNDKRLWEHTLLGLEKGNDISTLTIEQYIALIQDNNRPGIVKPKISDDVEFEINSNFMRELRRKLFAGTDDEDAHEHVVFPITLKGRALRWKKGLPAGMINTWDLLEKEFIWQYCSPFKTAKKLEEIRNFKQEIDDTLYHAWERYSDLLYRCLQHDLNCQ
ncbi:ribonuclease H-like domain-containing protein [Tanacetum coccineum]